MAEDEISKMILESKQSVSWANFLALMKEIVIPKKKLFSKGYTESLISLPDAISNSSWAYSLSDSHLPCEIEIVQKGYKQTKPNKRSQSLPYTGCKVSLTKLMIKSTVFKRF